MITDEEIDKLWDEVMDHPEHHSILDFARQLEQRAREEEREACAMLCDAEEQTMKAELEYDSSYTATVLARRIRARGKA